MRPRPTSIFDAGAATEETGDRKSWWRDTSIYSPIGRVIEAMVKSSNVEQEEALIWELFALMSMAAKRPDSGEVQDGFWLRRESIEMVASSIHGKEQAIS